MLQDRVSDCTFTRCKHPDCVPILHIRTIYFEGLFLMVLVYVTALVVMSNRLNQYIFSTLHRLSI